MAASEELGIVGLDFAHYMVSNPTRSQRFYTELFGFQPVYRSTGEMVERTGQSSTVYRAGDTQIAVSHPVADGCRAQRYLSRHPAGIGSLTFRVDSAQKAYEFLEKRGATFIHGVRETGDDDGGVFRHFSITSAIGDVSFRFLERDDYAGFAPGFEAIPGAAAAAKSNPLGIGAFDHITNNAQTMASVKLWMEHVLGMEQCWEIEFHTEDIKQGGDIGTGLKSQVMWDPGSGLKFPINEPLTPFFSEGQINVFIEQNHGAGVQHIALEVDDIIHAVSTLRERGVRFLNTPDTYYEATPGRLAELGVDVTAIDEDLEILKKHEILIDGKPTNRYLLQVFMQDASTLYAEPDAGPFFFELIQRHGDDGFGEGNFRALFEAIERAQITKEDGE